MSDLMGMRAMYLNKIPGEVPADLVVVHNSVRPARRLGTRGFRAWLADRSSMDRLEVCDCDWAPELGEHYRVRRDG